MKLQGVISNLPFWLTKEKKNSVILLFEIPELALLAVD